MGERGGDNDGWQHGWLQMQMKVRSLFIAHWYRKMQEWVYYCTLVELWSNGLTYYIVALRLEFDADVL